MGFLSKLSGRSAENSLVRQLLLRRVEHDPVAASAGFTSQAISRLSGPQLQASTEAAICSIVESYASLVRGGATPTAALARIEGHRQVLGGQLLPCPLDLRSYLQYRVAIEHAGPPLPSDHLEHCLATAVAFYDCPAGTLPTVQAGVALLPRNIQFEAPVESAQVSKAPAARQFRTVEQDFSLIFQRRQGRLFFAYTEEQLSPEIQELLSSQTNIEEAVTMLRAMHDSTTVVPLTPSTTEEIPEADDEHSEWAETRPPWGEGYLAQRELMQSLNALSMPGEREIPDEK